jgi:hypothetical protein
MHCFKRLTEVTLTKLPLRDLAKISKTFLRNSSAVSVADDQPSLRLAIVSGIELSRCYDGVKPAEVFAAFSPADWDGLAIIERVFAKLSRELSVNADERKMGVALFLGFALGTWEDVHHKEEAQLLFVAESFEKVLQSWLRAELGSARITAELIFRRSRATEPN